MRFKESEREVLRMGCGACGFLRPFLGIHIVKTISTVNLKHCFAFFTFVLSQVHCGVFQRLMCGDITGGHRSRYGLQLSSIKAVVKRDFQTWNTTPPL